jgi:predicted hotdog family 3-hydroxylacyl-ACP dehydratase
MLASAREVVSHVARLDEVDGELRIRATRISGDATALLYAFSISCGSTVLQTGRATIVLRPPAVALPNGGSA